MKKILLLSLILIVYLSTTAQVAINTDGSNPSNSSMLDIKSDTAGVLIPRMTAVQRDAINQPANGLMVYVNTDSSFYYYNGSQWTKIINGKSIWEKLGEVVYSDSLHKVVIGKSTGTGLFQVVTDKATSSYTADLCNGGTATAMEHQSSYVAANAFDNDLISLWRNNGSLPVWIQYDFGSSNEKIIEKYRLYWSGGDASLTAKDWQFQGSNNGTSWTSLDSRSGETWINGNWKEFTFSNSTKYRYYRLNITANNGGANNGLYLDEIELIAHTYNNYPALYVNNSRVGIGTDNPTTDFHINGNLRISDGSEGSGKVLSSDANGNTQWIDSRSTGNWTLDTDTLYSALDSTLTIKNKRLGIGTTNPQASLEVNDGILVTGTYGSGDTVSISGYGTRMFFNPRKGAFRAGYAFGNRWDNANIGIYSVAMGNWTTASGDYSTAMGDDTRASGRRSTAMGYETRASGSCSFAVGIDATASGTFSTAMGDGTKALSYAETAVGCYNTIYSPTGVYTWDASDRLFVIGNGEWAGRSDALIVYKSGRMLVNGPIWQAATGQSVFLGENAGSSDDLSYNNNVFVGYNAGTANTTGNDNTAIGYKAMEAVTSGQWNTAIGHYAFQTGNYSNSTALGDAVAITASSQVRIGHNVSSIGGPQGWTTVSDGRFKFDVSENVPGLDFIKRLRPVTYHLNVEKIDEFTGVSKELRNDSSVKATAVESTKQLRTGFIAQEVEKTALSLGYDFSGVDKPKSNNDYYGLRYAEFVVPLVKAVQEQQKMIENQKAQIAAQKAENEEMKAQLQQLMQRVQNLENTNN